MPAKINYEEGQMIGRLVFIKRTKPDFALFRCVCGKELEVRIYQAKAMSTYSCGCLYRYQMHGQNKNYKTTRAISTYYDMIHRCRPENKERYPYHAGKGITVCDRWKESFFNFIDDMGEPPTGKSLDRKDNLKGYSKDNCRWATDLEQNRNTSRTKFITYNGETKAMGYWAEQYNILPSVLNARLACGWSIERSLTALVRPRRKIIKHEKTNILRASVCEASI